MRTIQQQEQERRRKKLAQIRSQVAAGSLMIRQMTEDDPKRYRASAEAGALVTGFFGP